MQKVFSCGSSEGAGGIIAALVRIEKANPGAVSALTVRQLRSVHLVSEGYCFMLGYAEQMKDVSLHAHRKCLLWRIFEHKLSFFRLEAN